MKSTTNPTFRVPLLYAIGFAALLSTSFSRAADLVGTLPGDVSVDNKGSANYSIPIQVVPGRAGIQPDLAITYNSQSGNGIVGVGFNLSGRSSIERGRHILARDGDAKGVTNSDDDKLYLDGKRLIHVSGTHLRDGATYRTEVDSFSKVTAEGSGTTVDYFIVESKSGTTSYYGKYSADSSDTDGGADGLQVISWHLKRVEDPSGNYMAYHYTNQTNGEFTLERVEYTGASSSDAFAKVEFLYQGRTDDSRMYPQGFRRDLTKRLSTITVSVDESGWKGVHRYNLAYEYASVSENSRLTSVTYEVKEPAASTWEDLPPTNFYWSNGTIARGSRTAAPGTAIASLPDPIDYTDNGSGKEFYADFNGDGLTDYLNAVVGGAIKIALSNGTSFNAATTWFTAPTADFEHLKSGDFNGDGLTDLVWMNEWGKAFWAVKNTGASSFVGLTGGSSATSLGFPNTLYRDSSSQYTPADQTGAALGSRLQVSDLDGDGRDDLLFHGYDGKVRVSISSGTSFDSTPDIWLSNVYQAQTIALSQFPLVTEVLGMHMVRPMVGDYDGDGLSDYAWLESRQKTTTLTYMGGNPEFTYTDYYLHVALNDGGSFASAKQVESMIKPGGYSGNHQMGPEDLLYYVLPGDFNGDGLSDMLIRGEYNGTDALEWRLYEFTGRDGNDKVTWTLTRDALPESYTLGGVSDVDSFYKPLEYDLDEDPRDDGWYYYWDQGDFLTALDEGETATIGMGVHSPTKGGQFDHMFAMDFNGDGATDYGWIVNIGNTAADGWWVCYSDRQGGFRTPIRILADNYGYADPAFSGWELPYSISLNPIDIDGDGIKDWALKEVVGDTSHGTKYIWGPGSKGDLLDRVKNGLDHEIEIDYSPMTDGGVYEKGSGTTYPIREDKDSRYIVSEVFKDMGGNFSSGDKYRFSYSYSGHRTDLSGRGNLGFHSFVTLDHQTDLFSYQFLSQSFPMTGLVKREQTYRAYNVQETGGVVTNFDLLPISSQDNDVTFDEVNIPGSGLKGTVFPFMSHSQKLSWEDNAANALTIGVENPESLFDAYNSNYDENEQLAHSRINTYVWFDDQSQGSDPPIDLPLGYDDNSAYVAGEQDGVAVGFEAWNTQLDAIQTNAGSAHGKITYGNIRRSLVDYGDGFTSDTVTNYHSPSTYAVGLSGLVDWTKTTAKTPIDAIGQGSPVSRYTYHSTTGLVATEETDAGDASVFNANDALTAKKTFTYNAYGLLEKTEIEGHTTSDSYYVGAKRVVSEVLSWDANDVYPEKTENNYGHWSKVVGRDHYGSPTQVNDINDDNETTGGTKTEYDALGRITNVHDRLRGLETDTIIGETIASATDYTKTQTVTAPTSFPSDHTDEMSDALDLTSKYFEHVDPNNAPATTTYYDRLGRTIRVVKNGYNGQQAIVDTVYDLQGRAVAVSNPYALSATKYWAFTTYDELGRPYLATAPNGTKTTTLYHGRVTQVTVDATDRTAQTTTTLVNAKGDTVKVWNADNVPTNIDLTRVDETPSLEYVLDGFGRMIRTEAWQGSDRPSGVPEFLTIYSEYDALGNQTRLDDPDKGVWDYIYNALGQLTWQASPTGAVVVTEYDKLGRPLDRHTEEADNSETATWTYYDSVSDPTTNRVVDSENGWIGAVQKESVLTTDSVWSDNDNKVSQNSYYYDTKGNPKTVLNNIDDKWMYRYMRYDSLNRLQYLDYYWRPAGYEDEPQAYPLNWRRYGIENVYDSDSYITSIKAGDSANPAQYENWWVADSSVGYDLLDRPTKFVKGNGHTTTRTYDPITGTLSTLVSGSSGSIQSDTYTFDGLGNLKTRKNRLNKTETFAYDELNRLTSSTVGSTSRTNAYYDNGSIKNKQSVAGSSSGTYAYDGDKPHAVATAFGYNLDYDEAGNVKSRTGNGETWAFRWNATDKPHWMGHETSSSASGSAFRYGVDRMRIVHFEFDSFDKSGGSSPEDWKPGHYTRKKIYIGDGSMEYDYENTASAGSEPSWRVKRYRLYIPSLDGRAGAVEIDPHNIGSGAYDRQVYHYDHLGSIAAITPFGSTSSSYGDDQTGRDSLYSYDSWGQRREPLDWIGDPVSTSFGGEDDWATRGYTGHEMLDDLGLVHMNGRIYDPMLGRFLSADKKITYPDNLQSFNRYAYVLNNPLTFFDPNGYDPLRLPTPSSMAREAMKTTNRKNAAFNRQQRIDLFADKVQEGHNQAGSAVGIILAPAGGLAGLAVTGADVATDVRGALKAEAQGRVISTFASSVGKAITKRFSAVASIFKLNKAKPNTPNPSQSSKLDTKNTPTAEAENLTNAPASNSGMSAKEIKNARQRGVDRAKSAERDLVKSGHPGTADDGGWTLAERKQIAETGQFPSDTRMHHINDVKNNPGLADVPDNVIPSRGGAAGHVEKYHPQGTRAGSSGEMLDRQKLKDEHLNGGGG